MSDVKCQMSNVKAKLVIIPNCILWILRPSRRMTQSVV